MDDQQNETVNTSTPEGQSEVQNRPVSSSSQTQPEEQSGSKTLLVVGLLVVLVLVVAGVFGYMIFSNRSSQKTKAPSTNVSLSPVVPSITVSNKPVSTSSSGLSKDDSVETLNTEWNDTSIDNFSSDLQDIEKDINGL